jgi:hypothetical protein
VAIATDARRRSNACGSDGINSICFDQPDMGFTPGVLAFTRVIVADGIGIQVGAGPVATELGQILDADIYFNPNDIFVTFATPQVLAANPKSYVRVVIKDPQSGAVIVRRSASYRPTT